jgi:AAHS family 4-hydroxybenzoate transporter-like MFS transporter
VSEAATVNIEPAGFDIRRFLEERKLGRLHVLLTALGAAAVGMDGMDAQAIGYVAPDISREWGLPRTALGAVFSTSLLGMMLGSMIFGVLGDKLGRKRVITSCVLLIGLATLAAARAHSVTSLLIARLVVGVGIGGVGPNVYALLSEYSPSRLRATLIMLVTTAFPLGAGLGGILAARVVPVSGWRSIFWIAGTLTLLLVPVLLVWLPDSVRQMMVRGESEERVRGVLRRVAPNAEIPQDLALIVHDEPAHGFPVWELFRERRAAMTSLMWGMYFVTMLVNYFVSNWLPTLGHDAGLSLESALQATSLFQFGGVAGAIAFGVSIDRRQPRSLMTVAFAGTGLFVAALGFGWSSPWLMAVTAFGAGFCINGTQIGDTFIAAVSYPTALRSTGVGWGSAIGRIGAICGPLIGGILLAGGSDRSAMFLIAALLAALIAAAIFLLGSSLFPIMRGGATERPAEHRPS